MLPQQNYKKKTNSTLIELQRNAKLELTFRIQSQIILSPHLFYAFLLWDLQCFILVKETAELQVLYYGAYNSINNAKYNNYIINYSSCYIITILIFIYY